MNGLNWKIEHQCPQCGAPVTLEETDHIFTCAFCRTRLSITATNHFQYYIPPPDGITEEVIFIPYWRVRGLTYSFEPLNMTNRYIDTNINAVGIPGLPPSLGLRPQAMTLKFISPDTRGSFIKPQRELRDAMPEADRSRLASHHELFIGETVSLIYSPLIRKNDALVDPFLQKPVIAWHSDDSDRYPAQENSQSIRFVSVLCPQCGWDLRGDADALVLTCGNCNTAWSCKGDQLQQIPFAVMNGSSGPLMYLPFWRIKATISGLRASSFADFVRLANLPRAVTGVMEEMPLYFWSPAFKVNPPLFLRWSRQMTIFQPLDPFDDKLPASEIYSVNLPHEEAAENILVTLGSLMADKRTFYKVMPDIGIASIEPFLVYHPFTIGDRELTHEKMGVVIEKNALKYGATM